MENNAFPASLPKDDPVAAWSYQMEILAVAATLLGPRDASRKVYQPTFSERRPRLINMHSFDGAFAELSNNAGGYWLTLVFELAHETVHLLNPIAGYANWLEEGVAVAFSQHCLKLMVLRRSRLPSRLIVTRSRWWRRYPAERSALDDASGINSGR